MNARARAIEGWKAIASYVETRGVPMTPEQARRYARTGADRLPVSRIGTRGKPRIVAEVAQLDAWCERFRSTVWQGDAVMVDKGGDCDE